MAKDATDQGVDHGERNWRRIKATVKPLRGSAKAVSPVLIGQGGQTTSAFEHALQSPAAHRVGAGATFTLSASPHPALVVPDTGRSAAAIRRTAHAGQTLDASWDRTLRAGRIEVDLTIDLHGHTLASAHTHLSRALDRAVAMGARVILLIAGKNRGPDEAPRGAIRRELESWLAHSRHSSAIAAVRNAHPRHGGAGALYLILRRSAR
ncbi:MAG: Smr/MutS family protein [Sphingopyxis sp.]|nr:Smr/MutS family protein [Sphingopyxis sp.]